MQNWQQQPSKQLVGMLKWLFGEVAALHGRGGAHGALTMKALSRSPTGGWALAAAAPGAADATKAADAAALARLTAFVCLSSEQRREYQPHHLATLTDGDLLAALQHAPTVQILVAGLLQGNVMAGDALDYHLWHPLAVHAQARPPLPCTFACGCLLQGYVNRVLHPFRGACGVRRRFERSSSCAHRCWGGACGEEQRGGRG